MKRKLLVAAASATLIALAGCSDSAPTEPAPEEDAMPGMAEELPEPDVDDVPDVVATVNGTDITGADFTTLYRLQFQQMAMQAQMTGQEPDQDELKSQTLDSMIDSELLVQDAEARGHEASQEDIEALLEETAQASGMETVDELMQSYEEQGVTEEQVRDDAQTQMLVEELIEHDLDVPEPTDEQVEELYDQMGMNPDDEDGYELEEIRPELEAQILDQNRGQAIGAHLDELRQNAEIDRNM